MKKEATKSRNVGKIVRLENVEIGARARQSSSELQKSRVIDSKES